MEAKTKKDFEIIFLKYYNEFLRYAGTIIISRKISSTRVTPKDVVNSVFINISDKEKFYLNKDESNIKGTILQNIKWKIFHDIRKISNSFSLTEPDEHGIFPEDYLSYKDQENIFYKTDAQIYINAIKKHIDKEGAEFYIEYLSTNINSHKDLNNLQQKYNIDSKRSRCIIEKFRTYTKSLKFKSLIKKELYKHSKTNSKNVEESIIILKKYNNLDLTDKQKTIKKRIVETKKLLNDGVSIADIAKIFNVNRTTVYHYIKLGKIKWK